jgi:DNA repair exonuclease SbcCD ATPase subunit
VIILKHLQAENFKSLSSLDLPLPERGSVLIEGQNEAGKSTLFEAVYVALYGKPLVGEDSRIRQEQVIQYGQSRAIVQLAFRVGQHELTVRRTIEKGKPQQATLIIQQPNEQQEVVTGVRAVDERILKELGNLDGESLRNSCFVEQKELERIEELPQAKREEAIHKLLGLERLNRLTEQFKVKRERKLELSVAERYLKLAELQDEVRQASAQEKDMAEYLDAVKVASQVKNLSDLETQRGEVEKSQTECTQRAEEARECLARCEALKKQISYCDQATQQVAKVHHVQEILASWIRLKGVETTLASDPVDDTKLVDRCRAAEITLATVRTKMRLLLFTGIVLTALAVLSIVLEFLGYPAFVPLLFLVSGAIIMWLWFFRVRKDVRQKSRYLAQCKEDVHRLEIQRQAAIQAGGDPATLGQYEQLLQVTGVPLPPSLDAGRRLQEEIEQKFGAILVQGYNALQEAAKEAQANQVSFTEQLASRALRQEKSDTRKASFIGELTGLSAIIEELFSTLISLGIIELSPRPLLSKDVSIYYSQEQALTATLKEIKDAHQATLITLDEQSTRNSHEKELSEKGRREQQKITLESDAKKSRETIDEILSSRLIAQPTEYTLASIVEYWPLVAEVSPDEEMQKEMALDEIRINLRAAEREEKQLAIELGHHGPILSIEECHQKVDELVEERKICELATELLKETRDRIARHILPITERNMHPLLQQLTGGRYWDVRLTPEESNGQPGEMDYRIRIWDPAAKRHVGKNIFSGGTRDQCSLALRLAFALATLPQEFGVAPGFIFLDEPLSAFDAQRAQALVELLTTGSIAQNFSQVILISHSHAFDREVFHYHIHMENGQVIESDLPVSEAIDLQS